MGGIITRWWWGGDPDAVNPVSELTRRDVHVVQTTWPKVYTDAGKYGMELFLRSFRADPETKVFFKSFRDMTEEQLINSRQFKAHVINLMSAIHQAVVNLNQPELVAAMMEKLGESHGRRRITARHFNEVKDVFVELLRNERKLTELQIESWDRLMNFIYKHIFSKL